MPEPLKHRWQRNEVTLGAWCMIPSSLTAEILAKGGFDWVLVDMQHGCMGFETAVEMIRAIDLAGITPIVRIPWNEPGIVGRMLDAGAMGIVAPMINSVAEALRPATDADAELEGCQEGSWVGARGHGAEARQAVPDLAHRDGADAAVGFGEGEQGAG